MASFNNMRLGLMPVWHAPTRNPILEDGFEGFWVRSASARGDIIFQAQKSVTLNRFGFLFEGTVGQAPRFSISLQGVDAFGNPDGVKATEGFFRPPSPGDPNYNLIRWDNTFRWVSVNAASINRGQFYAMVLEYDAGTVNISNGSIFNMVLLGSSGKGGVTYVGEDEGFGRTRRSDRPIWGYRSDVTGDIFGGPINLIERPVFGAPSEKGLLFNLSSEYADTFSLAGIQWQGQHAGSATQSYSVKLYSGSGNLISSVLVDGDWSAGVARSGAVHHILFRQATLPTLSMGTNYIVTIAPTDATTGMSLDVVTTNSVDEMNALEGGSAFSLVEGSAGSFSQTKVKKPLIDLIISEWGAPIDPAIGIHVKVTPKYNDPIQVQHADDQIEANIVEIPTDRDPHEFPGFPIGDAVESYSGYSTIEAFRNPDAARSFDFLIHPEQPIEQLKFIRWDPFINETAEIVFRLRATSGSAVFREVTRYVRVILTTP